MILGVKFYRRTLFFLFIIYFLLRTPSTIHLTKRHKKHNGNAQIPNDEKQQKILKGINTLCFTRLLKTVAQWKPKSVNLKCKLKSKFRNPGIII